MKKLRVIARRLISLTLRRLFNPLYRRGIVARFPFTMRIYNYFFQRLNVYGLFEPGTIILIKKLLKEGMTFLDLGAHRGYYTLLASKLVGEKGRVFAFEPAPENFALLERNVKGRSNMTLVQKAVSNKSGTTRLFLSSKNTANHSLYDAGDSRESVEVEVISLDEFFKDKDSKIDVIKMDIEGAEMSALDGMPNIIKENENLRIITEFNPRALQVSGCLPLSFLERLVEYGFKLQVVDEDRGDAELRTVDDIMRLFQDDPQRVAVNIFCEKGHFSNDDR